MARILMVASEATPFAKTGGLADVAGALPVALRDLGHDVAVVMPRYRAIDWHSTESAWDNLTVWLGGRPFTVSIRLRLQNGVPFFFVEHNMLFDRAGLYAENGRDYGDNHIRFAVLSLAALGVHQTVFPADVLHVHDWQAALVPIFLEDQYHSNPAFYGVKTLLTIHNLGYQGRFGKNVLPELGLNWGWFSAQRLEYYDDVNFLKGGIVMADALTTVSPTYAEEIQTPEGGFGLDGVLRMRSRDLSGILNGVDYHQWNPEMDRFLGAHYSPADLAGKAVCKKELLTEFGLPTDQPDRPVVGIVSRFADQKGFDLVAGLAQEIAGSDVLLTVLGSGDWRYEELFRSWQRWLPDKVGIHIGYDNRKAHLIEAGADIFLMPSRYEPCGLNQMYSLKYGTVPLVRATGGLNDTIDEETGFKFTWYSAEALAEAFREALEAFADRDAWQERMRKGMAKDFSWDASARAYSTLYQKLGG
jgi:starch synthase